MEAMYDVRCVESGKCGKMRRLSKFTRQGKNGEKGRKIRKYFSAKNAKENRAKNKISYSNDSKMDVEKHEISVEEYERMIDEQAIIEQREFDAEFLAWCEKEHRLQMGDFDDELYFGRRNTDGSRCNFDDDGNVVPAIVDNFGKRFAYELSCVREGCYYCGSYGRCACDGYDSCDTHSECDSSDYDSVDSYSESDLEKTIPVKVSKTENVKKDNVRHRNIVDMEGWTHV